MVSELCKAIIDLGCEFSRKSNSYFNDAMQSKPEWVDYYNTIACDYSKAADICFKYSETQDFIEFIREIKEIGFLHSLKKLKNHIEDPELLEEIALD